MSIALVTGQRLSTTTGGGCGSWRIIGYSHETQHLEVLDTEVMNLPVPLRSPQQAPLRIPAVLLSGLAGHSCMSLGQRFLLPWGLHNPPTESSCSGRRDTRIRRAGWRYLAALADIFVVNVRISRS